VVRDTPAALVTMTRSVEAKRSSSS